MEVGEITYTEYSYEEREQLIEEAKQLRKERGMKEEALFETANKIRGFIVDQNLWNKPTGMEFSKLTGEVSRFYDGKDGREEVIKTITSSCKAYPKERGESIYAANICKCLTQIFKYENFELNGFQKEADSLLYRCIHLNTKAA